ncbi:16S rRNA (uracil(1498)-N(3))-methyltransferase [Patescibacteria group bacterium]|nr:16S rRNA (uracil(1498)-N(3))-methyltransferase [Patescibacteria group bacterium]
MENELPSEGVLLLQDAEIAHQLRAVLKIKTGESVLLFNGTGFDFEFAVKKLGRDHAFGHIVGQIRNQREPGRIVMLHQSLIKKNNFEFAAAKCAELGVEKFCPFVSARSVKKGIRRDRIEKILKESTEQCGGDRIPALVAPVGFAEAVKALPKDKNAENILFDPTGDPLRHAKDGAKNINIFIGPEGGFTEEELKMFRDAGGAIHSLGPRILRSETAAIVAAGLFLTPH